MVQVINDKSKEILYTVRVQGKSFQPKVYSIGPHTVKVGKDMPNNQVFSKTSQVSDRKKAKVLSVDLGDQRFIFSVLRRFSLDIVSLLREPR